MFQLLNSWFGRQQPEQEEQAPACPELHTPNISLSYRFYSSLRRLLCPSSTIIEVSWDDGKTWLPLDRDNSKQIDRVRSKQTISCVDIRNDRNLCKHLTHEGADVMIKVWLKDEPLDNDENDQQPTSAKWTVRRVKGWKKETLGSAKVPINDFQNAKWIYLPGPPLYEDSASPVPSFRVDSAVASIHESKSALDLKHLASKSSYEFTFQCPLPMAQVKAISRKGSRNLLHKISASSLQSTQSDFENELESCGWRLTQMQCHPHFDMIKPLRYTTIESYGAVEGVLAC
ncbi:hypothetical protein INT44_001585 [Umbelopsis vinacea]|uniref:Uncharacterized protein n=1 Tax=Umbelopsis vinacea TaxID=44442 RepID=A0A8H7UFX6_9FUNG|nr:hypothetical protein INT44_001585 [Umbelopsis vinacea]